MAISSRERAHRKRREILIGLCLMTACTGIALWIVLTRAGDWGVPGFSYHNEFGSACENGWVSDTCTTLTTAEVGHRLQIDLPEGSEIIRGTLTSGHTTTLQTEVRIPSAQAEALQARMAEIYGECRTDIPPPGVADGMPEPCIMANDQFASESMSERYAMALGTRDDEREHVLAVDFLWR